MKARLMMIVPVALAATALLAAGCGSDDEPEYCSDVSDLESSIDDLENVDLSGSDALSTVQTDVDAVKSNAQAVVASAKADFPDQTSALESSVTSLSNTIKQLPPSPTAEQLLPLAPQISSAVTAAKDLDNATSSACD